MILERWNDGQALDLYAVYAVCGSPDLWGGEVDDCLGFRRWGLAPVLGNGKIFVGWGIADSLG